MSRSLVQSKKYGFIGAGNMAEAVIRAFIGSELLKPEQIWATNRTERKIQKLQDELGIQKFTNNEELIDACDVIFIAVKPQDFSAAIEPIASAFTEDHIIISFAAGVTLAQMKKLIPQSDRHVRVIPNTPAKIKKAVSGYALRDEQVGLGDFIETLFATMGLVVEVTEGEELEALMVGCSSGVGFLFELMIYWQEWLEEHGFEPEEARAMTVDTFTGAALLAQSSENISLTELQNKVVSKKGVTAAGLDSMRELEIERALRISFEKAVLRDRELARTSVQ